MARNKIVVFFYNTSLAMAFSQTDTFSANYKSTSLTKYLSKIHFQELHPTNVCNSTAASKEISGLVIYGS